MKKVRKLFSSVIAMLLCVIMTVQPVLAAMPDSGDNENAKQTYRVIFIQTDGGTLADMDRSKVTDTDVSAYNENDNVTISVVPDEGYVMNSAAVSAGDEIVEFSEKDGLISFVMPAADVTVSAEFIQKESDKTESDGTASDKTESDGTESGKTELDRAESDRTKSDRTKSDRTKSGGMKSDKTETEVVQSPKTDSDGEIGDKSLITGFVDIDTKNIVEIEDDNIDAVLETLPSAITIMLDDGSTEKISVSWYQENPYEYIYRLAFDEDIYRLADGVEAPYVNIICYGLNRLSWPDYAYESGTVRMTKETGSTHYGSWSTGNYTVSHSGQTYKAYCAQASLAAPGTHDYRYIDTSRFYETVFGTQQIQQMILAILVDQNIEGLGRYADYLYADIASDEGEGSDAYYGYAHCYLSYRYTDETDYKGLSETQMTALESKFRYLIENDSDIAGIVSRYKLYQTDDETHQNIVWIEGIPVGYLNLRKTSANPSLTDNNSCYSLGDAEYGVYSDYACINPVGTLTTDVSGNSNTIELNEGTYYVKEITAPKGYVKDEEVHSVTVSSGNTETMTCTDEPGSDSGGIRISKADASTGKLVSEGTASLAGAQFTIKYYSGLFNTVEEAEAALNAGAAVSRTWVIQTKIQSDGTYKAALDSTCRVSGDDFYYASNGTVVLPVGTYTVQETKAPAGYTLNGYMKSLSDSTIVSKNGGAYISQVTEGNNFSLSGGSEYVFYDEIIRGGVKIYKMDTDKQKAEAQGGAALSGARFHIVTLNDNEVVVNGKTYTRGQTVTAITTDSKGYAAVGTNTLPYGNYKIVEVAAPEGYLGKGVTERTFSITKDGVLVDMTDASKSIQNDVIRGGVEIYKMDFEKQKAEAQGDASLAGAKFNIINMNSNSVVVDGREYAPGKAVKTITTNSKGYAATAANTLPYGHYKIVEASEPTGYLGTGVTEREFDIIKNSVIIDMTDASKSIQNDVIRGGVKICKRDYESEENDPLGGAALQGAVFEITNLCSNSVYVDSDGDGIREKYEPGEVVLAITTDKDGYAATETDALPYGHYKIAETKPPTGYLGEGITEQEFVVTENGVHVDLTDADYSMKNQVIRGDFDMTKINADTQRFMGGVTFKITSKTTGEYHCFTTDENGYYSSSSDWNKHTYDTNGGTAESGLWFGWDSDSNLVDADDSLGALPYDTYIIEEIEGENNQGMRMYTGTLVIYKNNYTVHMNNIENDYLPDIVITTKALDGDTGTGCALAQEATVIKDSVTISGLNAGDTYTLVGMLVDSGTNQIISAAEANTFEAKTKTVSKTMEFNFDSTGFEGRNIVAYEYLYMDDKLVALHEDLKDEEQTIHFPKIDTSALDSDTGENASYADDTITIIDTVSYKNIDSDCSYSLVGTVMDKETGEPLVVNGKTISKTITLDSKTANGSADISFTFSGKGLEGKTLVVYEKLYYKKHLLACHTDMEDEKQTIHIPEIGTSAADADTGINVSYADDEITVIDTVTYRNLVPHREYILTGVLMDRETGKEVLDEKGNKITAQKAFTPEDYDGTAEVSFTFSGNGLAGTTMTAFETLTRNGKTYAVHADIGDEKQTEYVPKISTSAMDSETGENAAFADDKITIADTLFYTDLSPDYTYIAKGILYDRETGQPLRINGESVTAEAEFSPKDESGSIELVYTFDGSGLEGKTLVIFETVYYDSSIVQAHTDINDESQSVHIPKIGTNAVDSETGTNLSYADDEITVTDTVSYENLIPGKKYIMQGTLMDKETGEPILDDDGDEITSETQFIPTDYDGTVEVTFIFGGTGLAGTTAVVFETLTRNDKVYAVHADINDKNQTQYIPKISTSAADADTKDTVGVSKRIIDTVEYTGLKPGVEYTVKGVLTDKKTNKPVLTTDGEEVTGETVFIPETTDGAIEVVFDLSEADVEEDGTYVVFERMYFGSFMIADHQDIGDERQTIHIPKIRTHAQDENSGANVGTVGEKSRLVDKVDYTNLVPGKEYTVSGVLMDRETGKEFSGADGNPVKAEKTFIPKEADGSVELVFEYTSRAGFAIVVFEELYHNGVKVAAHKDIADEDQTICYPEIHMGSEADGEHEPDIAEKVSGVKTGDGSLPLIPAIVSVAAGSVGFVCYKRRRKNHKKV